MPAEWTPHEATWTCWPFDDAAWRGRLEPVRREVADFLRLLVEHEPVHLLVTDEEAEADARARLPHEITLHRVPLDDCWFRDSGPIWVTRPDGAVSFVNWRFNAWGGKFPYELDNEAPEALARILDADHFDAPIVMEGGSLEVNGAGLALTTRQCLLSPHRNPDHTPQSIEDHLRQYLGIQRIVWLEQGLEGDHTDGHIDTIARFVDESTVVCCVTDDESDPNYGPTRANLDRLRQAGLTVLPIPLPQQRMFLASGERLPPTYANFYICNSAVLVPTYDDPHDAEAMEILRPLFPGRAVIPVSAANLIHGGGAFHCMTQQQPRGTPWRHE